MYTFSSTHTVSAPRSADWRVWSDMTAYPDWDPRELELRLDGPFAAGTTGYSRQRGNPGGPFRIESVDEAEGWVNVSALPGGELRVRHRLTDADGGTRLDKSYEVSGPMRLAFRIWWGPVTLRAMPATWAALDARIAATMEA